MPASQFNDGEQIPPVDPEDLRRRWNIKPGDEEALIAHTQEGDRAAAVGRRDGMIRKLAHFEHGQLLAPWRHGEELDDAVFRIAATFPMRALPHRVYTLGGEELHGFDPNAFVQQLIDETGISHTWEPIPTRVAEGRCGFGFIRVRDKRQASPDPQHLFMDEREAKLCALEVLWDAWDKYLLSTV